MGKIDSSILARAERIREKQEEQEEQLSLPIGKKAEVVQLTAWRYAREVSSFPFVATRAGQQEIAYTSPDGNYSVIGRSATADLPTVWDLDVLEYVISKGREEVERTEDFRDRVCFSIQDCLRELGLSERGGKQRKRILDGLERFAGASYWTNRFNRGELLAKSVFHILEYSWVKVSEKEERIEVKFCPSLVDSIRKGQINALDNPIRKKLLTEGRSGLKKALLRVVSARIGRKSSVTFKQDTLKQLCLYQSSDKEFRRKLKRFELPWEVLITKQPKGWYITFNLPRG